ncbi:MAG: dipeptidase [Chloroflexi bacterium]|nr:dipeptidase [Chloroflexota bacterium]
MSSDHADAIHYAHQNPAQFIQHLKEFIQIPSVSTDPNHTGDMDRATRWLSEQLHRIGIVNSRIIRTGGHPVVYAEQLSAGPAAPVVLIYGHYDVQPAEPLNLWQSDPFNPEQRGDNLYGRGSSDMKGQIMATLDAVESVSRNGGLPVNLKFLFEGEEEIGSPSLEQVITENKHLLKTDLALNPDAGMIAPDTPSIVYALRGLAYFELRVFGPTQDLHSGMYGGVIHNPAQALSELIAGMHNADGSIALPGYYDKVKLLSAEEKEALSRLPIDNDFYIHQTGVPALWGEKSYTPVERTGARPTLEINGMESGFTGSGSKTIIPAWAMAKISMRLVPEQDPQDVERQLRQYLIERAPSTIRWELKSMAGGPASLTPRDTPGVVALSRAIESVWGKPPLFKREGGSIPVVVQMKKILGIDSVLTGFGLPDDNVHGPNEKLHLPTWSRGIDALIHFFYNIAETYPFPHVSERSNL